MTCSCRAPALSGLEPYRGIAQSKSEVYVLRLNVQGAEITKPTHVLLFARAVGQAFTSGFVMGIGRMEYDVRGVVISGSGSTWTLDVICTYDGEQSPFTPNWFRLAPDLAVEIALNADLRAQFPGLLITGAGWYYMAGSDMEEQVSFWLSAPLLFDHKLGDRGGVTQWYGLGRGVWIAGTDGNRGREWKLDEPPPIGPGIDPSAPGQASTPWWLVIAALGVGAYFVWDMRKKR